ncbi:MAG TPA: methyltransferase domain-containing protein [Acidimicrobiales bacterium]
MVDFDPTAYGASGIADDYDRLYGAEWDTDAAVELLAELAAGGRVLELGIGTGRIALPLVARGIEVHGIDASPDMVAALHAKPGGEEIPVHIGDFSTVDAGRGFSLVAIPFNTIFALPDQDAQVACFINAARHLAPGGAFVVEAWVPDLGPFRHNRLVRPRVSREEILSIETVTLDPVDQMMRTTQAVLSDRGVRLYPANHRYAWPAELDLMGRLAGFVREVRWEDWRRTPFDGQSRAHVTVYRLAPDEPPAPG